MHATCNFSLDCSTPASEETEGWEAMKKVSICRHCINSKREDPSKSTNHPKEISKSKKTNVEKRTPKNGSTLRNELPLKIKIDLIKYAEANPKIGCRELGKKFSCSKTQANTIVKKKRKFLDEWESNEGSELKKRGRKQTYDDVNSRLKIWYDRLRQSNVPVSGPLLQEEALEIAKALNVDDFHASNGWLEKWKKRYNIVNMNVAGEEGDVNEEVVNSWEERARELVDDYKPEDVWNFDETGLMWRALPEKSLNEKRKRCRGGKNSKYRNTWAFFVNAAGEKEDPIVIGKSANPRCFKRLKNKTKPFKCSYFSNAKAWMRAEIITQILNKLNNRLRRENRNIILFMDNAPCHPRDLQFSNIKIAWLPCNTTSKTQPLDAGIIKVWKVDVRRKLLRYVCSQLDGKNTASDVIKSVNMLMSIQWGKQAWDDVKLETVMKCFKKVGLCPRTLPEGKDDDPFAGEDIADVQDLVHTIDRSTSIDEYICDEDSLPTCDSTIDTTSKDWREEVRNEILGGENSIQEESDEIEEPEVEATDNEESLMTSNQALQAAEDIAKFALYHGDEELANYMSPAVDHLRELKLRRLKQSSITSYFV